MSQISAVTTDSAGRLVSYIEGPYAVTVRRDTEGRPLVARAVSPGKPTLESEFRYSSDGKLTGVVGSFESAVLGTLVGEASRGGAVSAGTATDHITGAVTGLVGDGGVTGYLGRRNWYIQPSSYVGNPLSNGTIGDISSSADRVAQFAGMGEPIVLSGVSRFGSNLSWGTTNTPDANYVGSSVNTVYTSTPINLQSSASAWLKFKDNNDGTQSYGMGRVVKYTDGRLRFHQTLDDALVGNCPRVQWYSSALMNLRKYRLSYDVQFGDATTPFPAYASGKDAILFTQLKGTATQPVLAGVVKYDPATNNSSLMVEFNIKQTNGGAVTNLGKAYGIAIGERVRFEIEGLLTFNGDGYWVAKCNGSVIGVMSGNTLMSDLADYVQLMIGIYRYQYYDVKAPDDCAIIFHAAGIEML